MRDHFLKAPRSARAINAHRDAGIEQSVKYFKAHFDPRTILVEMESRVLITYISREAGFLTYKGKISNIL